MGIMAIQDALDALVAATVPTYIKLSDATDITDNPNIYLEKGFATSIGGAVRETRELCNGIFINRSMTLILTNSYDPNLDADSRRDAEQALMQDQVSILLALNADRQLGGNCTDVVYSSDNGIEYIVDQEYNKQYIGIVTEINIQYVERV